MPRLICLFCAFAALAFFGVDNCFAAENSRIGLQNIYTRAVVYCYANSQYSAEDCASYYETLGYIRMRNLPSKTAKYDFLAVDTYPTRRWRSGELTPRW